MNHSFIVYSGSWVIYMLATIHLRILIATSYVRLKLYGHFVAITIYIQQNQKQFQSIDFRQLEHTHCMQALYL